MKYAILAFVILGIMSCSNLISKKTSVGSSRSVSSAAMYNVGSYKSSKCEVNIFRYHDNDDIMIMLKHGNEYYEINRGSGTASVGSVVGKFYDTIINIEMINRSFFGVVKSRFNLKASKDSIGKLVASYEIDNKKAAQTRIYCPGLTNNKISNGPHLKQSAP